MTGDSERKRRRADNMTDDQRLDAVLRALMHDADPEAIAQVKHVIRCFLRWYGRARTVGRWTMIGFFGALGAALFSALAMAIYQGALEQFNRVVQHFTGG